MLIALDPGHGGTDPGALGPSGLRESQVNLSVALLVRESLVHLRHQIIMTRSTDVAVSLAQRAIIANNANAHWYVAIHCNGFTNPTAGGTETFHFPGSRNGERLARALQNNLMQRLTLANRGVKTASFSVLQSTRMPAALVELAFITNPAEERLLGSRDFQVLCAAAMVAGISQL